MCNNLMDFIDINIYKDLQGLYLIRNLINNKIYIGKTEDRFIERYWHHIWKLNNQTHDNKYLQKSWNKYGEYNFSFEAIYILNKDDNINQLEIDYIKKYKLQKPGVYNMTDGGDGAKGRILSEEHKRKIGEKNRTNMIGKNILKKRSIK